jgi:hypothetical protein
MRCTAERVTEAGSERNTAKLIGRARDRDPAWFSKSKLHHESGLLAFGMMPISAGEWPGAELGGASASKLAELWPLRIRLPK